MKSLGEILDRGLYHLALEDTFRARNAVEKRGLDAERRARVKRAAIRDAVVAVLDEHRLAALVYPTLRRKPARLGDAQGGTNCSFSAHSGLPALGVPAAWTDDGLPIGVDLLGRPWSDAELLALGFGFEQTLKLRRPPFSTPALVDGKAPAPTGVIMRSLQPSEWELKFDVEYDPLTSRLSYKVDLDKGPSDVIAIWLHRGTRDKPGAGIHQIFAGHGAASSGTVVLSYADRVALAAGGLLVRTYTKQRPGGFDAQLRLSPTAKGVG